MAYFNDLEGPDPPDCILQDQIIDKLDEIHVFGESDKCINCGWTKKQIIEDPCHKPWEVEIRKLFSD